MKMKNFLIRFVILMVSVYILQFALFRIFDNLIVKLLICVLFNGLLIFWLSQKMRSEQTK